MNSPFYLNLPEFDAVAHSIPYFEKEKNGDHFIIRHIPEENLLIAAVSDGVSQQPCDWMASETACEAFGTTFEKLAAHQLDQRLHDAVAAAHKALINVTGKCKKLAATISALAWDYTTETCLIASVGDSRIYHINAEKIVQLTTDDAITGTKQIMTSIGRRTINTSKLTEALGKPTPKIETQVVPILPKTGFVLATDGFFEARPNAFDRTLTSLTKSSDLKAGFLEVITDFEWMAKDDLTAMLIWKK